MKVRDVPLSQKGGKESKRGSHVGEKYITQNQNELEQSTT